MAWSTMRVAGIGRRAQDLSNGECWSGLTGLVLGLGHHVEGSVSMK